MKNKNPVPSGVSGITPALLTVEQAAAYLNSSTVWAIRRLIYGGKIPYVKVGRRYNIRKADLDSWIESNARQAA